MRLGGPIGCVQRLIERESAGAGVALVGAWRIEAVVDSPVGALDAGFLEAVGWVGPVTAMAFATTVRSHSMRWASGRVPRPQTVSGGRSVMLGEQFCSDRRIADPDLAEDDRS